MAAGELAVGEEEMPGKLKAESENPPILIKAYGEFWSPDLVKWEGARRLLGTSRPNSRGPTVDVDVYEQRGIYVLYNDFAAVYVGRADKQSIGHRLQLHRGSRRKAPRWNRFSWFGVRGIRKNGELGPFNASAHLPIRISELIATLEALLIIVIDPRLNAKRESLKNAILLHQSDADKPIDVDRRLQGIERRLELALESEKKRSRG